MQVGCFCQCFSLLCCFDLLHSAVLSFSRKEELVFKRFVVVLLGLLQCFRGVALPKTSNTPETQVQREKQPVQPQKLCVAYLSPSQFF